MKKLWSHGWFAALLAGVAFLLIPTVSAGADTSTTIQGRAPAAVPANEAGPTPSAELIEFDVGIELKDLPGAEALAKEVTDPTSRNYRRYLTPQQWESRFSPSVKADREVEASLRSAGIKIVKVAPDRMTIVAEGTAEQIDAYFGTTLANYEVGEETVRLASSSLSAPTNVAPLITGVRGVNEIHAKPANLTGAGLGDRGDRGRSPWGWSGHGHGHGGHGHWPPPQEEEVEEIPQPLGFRNATPCSAYYGQELASTLPGFGDGFPNPLPYAVCGYKPAQLQGAYNLTGPIAQGNDGSGVTVAIVDAFVSPTLYSDAVEYAQKNQGSTASSHGSSQQWRPGQFKEMIQRPFTQTEECEASGWSGEQTLDVEAVHAMAPGAKVLYVGGKNCTVSLYNAVEEVVDGHLANIVSDSWSNGPEEEEGETTESREAFNHVLLMAAGTGVGVQFSSGDEGDNFIVSGEQQPSFPGTSPYATAVGGTSLEIGAQNNRLGEVGWSTGISALCTKELAELGFCEPSEVGEWEPEAPGEYDYGGGGGTTNQYPEPWYQEPVVPTEIAGRLGTGKLNRVVPDISMEGDPSTGMLVGETQEFADGTYYDQYRIGGTSLSSPLFAGLMADADQAARGSLGFVNPLLYRLDSGGQNSQAFYDILPAGKQAVVRNDYLNEENAEAGILTTARILGLEGATEYFCEKPNEETGECEVAIEEAPESLSAAPGFDSMTGIGSPGDQFIQELIRH
ncbi:MAG TPA: S53 family peptidase [Solirubrobacterales bacterium]|nr:S53 family peptidase [Solirubrobacterales bacterium]